MNSVSIDGGTLHDEGARRIGLQEVGEINVSDGVLTGQYLSKFCFCWLRDNPTLGSPCDGHWISFWSNRDNLIIEFPQLF